MPTFTQVKQVIGRFGSNDGSESGHGWLGAENANISLAIGSLFLIRFDLEDATSFNVTAAFQLQYNLTGTWNNVNASSLVVRSSATTFITDGTVTTQRLSESGMVYVPGVVDTVDGLTPAITLTPSGLQGSNTEVEFCCVLRSEAMVGLPVLLRVIDGNGNVLIQYLCTPTITVLAAPPPPPAYCWTLTATTATIDNPDTGDKLLLKNMIWATTHQVVTVKVDKLQVTCTAKGGVAVPKNLLVAITKTGDRTAATSWHSFAITADGVLRDLGVPAIDFTGELTLSTAEIASGLVGILIDFDGTFNNCELVIAGGKIQLGQSATAIGTGAYGLIYGEVSTPTPCDEYLAVIGGGAFTENGQFVDLASQNNWSANLSPDTVLVSDIWNGAPFLGEFFITNDTQGVFRRRICADASHVLEPLYRDYINPQGSGGMSLNPLPPPYNGLVLNHTLDSLTSVAATGIFAYSGFPTAPTAVIDPGTNLVTIHITNPVSGGATRYVEFEIRLASALDLSSMRYLALHLRTSTSLNSTGQPTRLDFGPNLSNSTIRFGESAGGTYAGAAIAALKVDTEPALQNASHYIWFDLQSLAKHPLMPAVSLIRIRFPAQNFFQIGYVYLQEFIQGGQFYHHNGSTLTMLNADPADDTKSGGPVNYAFNYTEGGQPAGSDAAHKTTLPAATHLGLRPEPLIPFDGSIVTATIPAAPSAIFSPAALLKLYRAVGTNWYFLASQANTGDFSVVDTLSDFEILNTYSFTIAASTTGPKWGDTYTNNGMTFTIVSAPALGAGTIVATGTGLPAASGNLTRTAGAGDAVIAFSAYVLTYPLTVLSFAAIAASGSGQVTGVIKIWEWKGSLLYSLDNGKVAGSQTNDAQNVQWDGISLDLTGIAPSAVPRTLQIASNGLPVLAGVGGAVNYMWTRKAGYTMRSFTTFAEADFPTRMDGARGVVGTKAACLYEAGALFGADDGLRYVAVNNSYNPAVESAPPDAYVEITKTNRGLWAKLIGGATSRTKLVVQTTGDDIWCFCENRYIHIDMRRGRVLTYGEWSGGKSVADAKGDPRRGMVVLFTDGSLGLCGPYLSDGGLDLAGLTGTSPTHTWTSKRYTYSVRLLGIQIIYENQLAGQQSATVTLSVNSQRGTPSGDNIVFTDPSGVGWIPFDSSIVALNNVVGGEWFELTLTMPAWMKVTKIWLHVVDAQPIRMKRG